MQFALVFFERFHYTLFARLLSMLTRIDHSLALLSLTGLRLKYSINSLYCKRLKRLNLLHSKFFQRLETTYLATKTPPYLIKVVNKAIAKLV